MCITQKLRFFNSGNASAEVRWDENKEKAFKISPMHDIIQPPIQKEKYPGN